MMRLALVCVTAFGLVAYMNPAWTAHDEALQSTWPMDTEPKAETAEQPASLNKKQEPSDTGEITTFGTVNGIGLDDSPSEVRKKAGEPLKVERDEILQDREEHIYANETIGYSGDEIEFIKITNEQDTVDLDGVKVPMEIVELKKRLGSPDFTAEDGLVYIRDEICLKLFYEQGTTQLESLQVYWLANV
ncbi:hypothetical protein [Paenibacillus pinihumi]|uniref:hypothetical protein n=1 Tax=Paenibacillus pinihumi TaxID=669462 RepID=UPI0003F6ACC0|nr:hypothetical protein [Paenibacillus pinihumi]